MIGVSYRKEAKKLCDFNILSDHQIKVIYLELQIFFFNFAKLILVHHGNQNIKRNLHFIDLFSF